MPNDIARLNSDLRGSHPLQHARSDNYVPNINNLDTQ